MFLFVIYKFLVKIVVYFEFFAISPDRNAKLFKKEILLFLDRKERPQKLLLWLRKIVFLFKNLECKAGLASEKK